MLAAHQSLSVVTLWILPVEFCVWWCLAQCVHKNVHLAATAQTWNGQSLWHLAARYGHAELLRALADAIRYNANAGPKQWRRLLR